MPVKRKITAQTRHKPGTAPGTLVPPPDAPFSRMHLMAFDLDNIVESTPAKPEDVLPYLQKWPVTWLNVDGLGSTDMIEKLGALFNLHPLSLEDVLHTHQRPKTEEFSDYIFVVIPMGRLIDDTLNVEQISLFLGKNFVITFQERPDGDCFDPVRERIRHGKGRRVKFSLPDYVAYALIDAVIDGYFPVLEYYGRKLDEIEDDVVARPDRRQISRAHSIKRDLHYIKHTIWPMREMINGLMVDYHLIREETRPYLRDCYDHLIQILDFLETYRERSSSLVEIYLSSISNKMNEVIQVLTIISTIFIPLSFIASVYGMNFDPQRSPWNMPELEWTYGYPFVLSLMALVAGILLFFFWRKGWLGLPLREGKKRRRSRDD